MGKTVDDTGKPSAMRKHPHVHGEDELVRARYDYRLETPPRAWGRLVKFPYVFSSSWKHPHVHGEDEQEQFEDDTDEETPPRAWGRHSEERESYLAVRNTPTCMGKTEHKRPVLAATWKHPHVHGEDLQPLCNNTFS